MSMAGRINFARAWEKAVHVYSLLKEHIPEPAPPLLLSLLLRRPPANPTTATLPEFAEPVYRPILVVTAEDLAPFNPRDWGAFLARSTPSPSTVATPSTSTAASPSSSTAASPSTSTAAIPSPSTEDKPSPLEVGLIIVLAGASIFFAVMAVRTQRNRRGGGGSGGGARNRTSVGATGLLSLLPRGGGGRDHAGARPREVVLKVRQGQALSFRLPVDALERSSERVNCKFRYLSKFLQNSVGTDSIAHHASVPEWKDAPTEEEKDRYQATTLTKLASVVCPLNMDLSVTDQQKTTRKEWVDNCDCSKPGSEYCVGSHIKRARIWIKDQLGEEAFRNCGLHTMGQQVEELWTTVDKKKLEDVDKLIPQNKHQNFMKTALKELSHKEPKDLAQYCYNVFLPRRLAILTRAEHLENEAVDTDDEMSGEDDRILPPKEE